MSRECDDIYKGAASHRYIERAKRLVPMAALLGVAACSGSTSGNADHVSGQKHPGMSRLVAGCKIFGVYAQNRFQPYGVAVRERPSVLAPKNPAPNYRYSPNEVLPIDGWEHTGTVAYPQEGSPQLRSDIWFHVAAEGTSRAHNIAAAWVSFAGVRAVGTSPDPNGLSRNVGELVQPPPDCQITPPIDVN